MADNATPNPLPRSRPLSIRMGVLLLVAVLVLAGAAAAAAAALLAPAEIAPGDHVYYHYNAYTLDGELVYTTDAEVARAAIAAGNPYLDPNLSASRYRVRDTPIVFERITPELQVKAPVQTSRFLVGYAEGDTVSLPPIQSALGSARVQELPQVFGPVDLEFTLNLTALYGGPDRQAMIDRLGPRENLQVGQTVPYAEVLEAEIASLSADLATFRVKAEQGARVRSTILGFNLTVEEAPGEPGRVLFRPDLRAGERFTTVGCQLPVEDLPAGTYEVIQVGANLTVRAAPDYVVHVLDKVLRIELRVLKVEKPSIVQRALATFGIVSDN
ncbi:MAG TPA: hypothetical protein VNZ52_14350 [Candidatus Thermoplasmatota archaeon]|nr:hypothetical protein [Candidatus Thermoplasmatota archaeon]